MTKCICTLFMYELTVQGKYPSLFASIKYSILIKRKLELLRPHSGEALKKNYFKKLMMYFKNIITVIK